MLTPMALEEPALLNAILAVAAAHLSKWQQVEDTESHKYLRRALVQLQEVLGDPESAVKESTLGTILFLASYEVRSLLHLDFPVVQANPAIRCSTEPINGNNTSRPSGAGSS